MLPYENTQVLKLDVFSTIKNGKYVKRIKVKIHKLNSFHNKKEK
jgi:hypothetical protein